MKLVDILNEIETNEVVTEVATSMVDEIGKFFIVEKPTKDSEMEDVVYELDLPSFALQIKGGLDVKNILGIYKQKLDAKRAGSEALNAYQDSLKEMEDAMESFRGAKKDIEEKKRIAKEKIQKLKQ